MNFPTSYSEILERMAGVDPVDYGRSRNFIDGAVTYLSPYISRGVISTKQVMDEVLQRSLPFYKVEKFVQELAWRDYWQQIWIAKADEINEDLKRPQEDVLHYGLPQSIENAETGIKAIDQAITNFYKTGYIHNHVRMYIAALACNIGKCHWKIPAQWMYYHLLDGDWASNALSWQWVAGANSNKKYNANQANINKYCHTDQQDTFLDVSYEHLAQMGVPQELNNIDKIKLSTPLPERQDISINKNLETLLYTYYNLDPRWYNEGEFNRILLLEPSVFEKYPVSKKSLDFALSLGKNIPGLKVFVGEIKELQKLTGNSNFIFKEHPLNTHFSGKQEERDWMFSVKGYYPSFFAYWKKCKKEL
ncbi:deoxyribodipyrimidine photolyase [bacterium]|nr:deoxyribodipyrimidine photolyase [bacterium]